VHDTVNWPTKSKCPHSALDARRATSGKRPHLFECRHGRISREGRQERAVRPAKIDGFLFWLAREETVEKTGGKPIPAVAS
jgi:hypothetical protein